MQKPIIFMFSGQGSQYYQMGKQLFNYSKEFREWMIQMDAQVSKVINRSIVTLLYDDDHKKELQFDRMLYTHPAIFMVEYALTQLLKKIGVIPDYVLGASLGEFTAAVVAGVTSVDEMLVTLVDHARLCEQRCKGGCMIAIFDNVERYYSSSSLYKNCEISSYNFNSHFVVSGSVEGLNIVIEYLSDHEINYQILPVAHAFHSSVFDPIKPEFLGTLNNLSYNTPSIPIISCASAKEIKSISPEIFWNAMRNPILFHQTILEVERQHDAIYIDVGPSGTLSTFTKYILPDMTSSINIPILTPFGQDIKNLKAVEHALCSGVH